MTPDRFPKLAPALVLVFSLATCAAPDQTGSGKNTDSGPDVAAKLPAAQCSAPAVKAGPDWLRRGVGYQIWVRSFADSDSDGIGDLKGIVQRLDYLNDGKKGGSDLGVDILWLSPIFASPSDHGYDTTDHLQIESDYGTGADLDALIAACQQRGIRLVLDLVINHVSKQHPWFSASKAGPKAAKRDWFLWRDSDPGWTQPWGKTGTWHPHAGHWYYGLFSSHMPDLNLANTSVEAEITAVARHWLKRGVHGFRLDAARYLVETGGGAGQADTAQTHALWRRMRKAALAERPEAALIGEVWTNSKNVVPYLSGDELHGCFDFDSAAGLRKGSELASSAMWRGAMCKTAAVTGGIWGRFGGNHDMARLADLTHSPDGHKVALAAVLLVPGTPWIYYGDELALPSGEQSGDRAWRLPMPWQSGAGGLGFSTGVPWQVVPDAYGSLSVAAQLAKAGSTLRWTRELIALRRQVPALAEGPWRMLEVTGDASFDVAVLQIGDHAAEAKGRALLVLNLARKGSWTVPPAWRQGASRLLTLPEGSDAGVVAGPGVGLWRW